MRRREFITIFGGAAMAPPLAARAQKPERLRRVGILIGTAESDPLAQAWIAAFESGLKDLGWKRDRNIGFDFYWGNAIGDLRSRTGGPARKAASGRHLRGRYRRDRRDQASCDVRAGRFAVVNDPVAQGYVSSMAKPGGNITGFSLVDYSVLGKAMDLLH